MKLTVNDRKFGKRRAARVEQALSDIEEGLGIETRGCIDTNYTVVKTDPWATYVTTLTVVFGEPGKRSVSGWSHMVIQSAVHGGNPARYDDLVKKLETMVLGGHLEVRIPAPWRVRRGKIRR